MEIQFNVLVSCDHCQDENGKQIFFASGQEDCAIKPSTIARHAQRHHGRLPSQPRSRKRRNGTEKIPGPRKRLRKEAISAYDKKVIWDANIRVITSGESFIFYSI